MRSAEVERKTKETDIAVRLNIDGSGEAVNSTGIGFLDHMLDHLAVHGLFNLEVKATGDLHVDAHHTVEDCGILLGRAFDDALGDRAGIRRVGSATVPMDEALAFAVVDFSGRPYTVFQVEWRAPTVGGIDATLINHFWESFAVSARCNLHARIVYGENDHHKAEALFKAVARALDMATQLDERRRRQVPSTKGVL